MSDNIEMPDDDDIPAEAFTGPAPKTEAKERKGGGNAPTGPACPVCKRDEQGRVIHTWANQTKNNRPYYRCSHCKGCWWPDRDDMRKIDVASKWPPLDKPKEKQ